MRWAWFCDGWFACCCLLVFAFCRCAAYAACMALGRYLFSPTCLFHRCSLPFLQCNASLLLFQHHGTRAAERSERKARCCAGGVAFPLLAAAANQARRAVPRWKRRATAYLSAYRRRATARTCLLNGVNVLRVAIFRSIFSHSALQLPLPLAGLDILLPFLTVCATSCLVVPSCLYLLLASFPPHVDLPLWVAPLASCLPWWLFSFWVSAGTGSIILRICSCYCPRDCGCPATRNFVLFYLRFWYSCRSLWWCAAAAPRRLPCCLVRHTTSSLFTALRSFRCAAYFASGAADVRRCILLLLLFGSHYMQNVLDAASLLLVSCLNEDQRP